MSSVSIHFEAPPEEPKIVIRDPIEGRSVSFETDRPVSPVEESGDEFIFPIDAACSIESSEIFLGKMVSVYVRSSSGQILDRIRSHQQKRFPSGSYQVEVGGPIKLYVKVEGPVTFDGGADHLRITTESSKQILLGARSYHESPAATITTTTEPEDLMAAISAFSSALKTVTPEVAYPTLRGHPPLLKVGEELSIPSGIQPKGTGITIEVPPELRMIFPVASLAFYLGADIRPGEPPRIVIQDGYSYPLVTERWFEDEVARVLKQTLVLDSIVRTEGIFGNDLYERRIIEPALDVPIEKLYQQPPHKRLQSYLKVDYDTILEAIPRWVMTAYVPPTGEGAEVLPYLVNELSIIRNPRGTRIDATEAQSNFGVPHGMANTFINDGKTVRLLVRPELFDDSVEHVWFGDHVPIGATKGTIEAFERKVEKRQKGETLRIAVVGNDPGLVQEPDVLEEAYRGRSDIQYDIDTFVGATTAKLRDILRSGYDFFHYIGETSTSGIHGTDGTVDVRESSGTNISAFLIDADHSFEEALAIAKNGGIGGIGTVGTVERGEAIEIGRAIARLLHLGFSIRGALDIVREQKDVGDQYVVVGDGSIDIAQPKATIPSIVDIHSARPGEYSVAMDAYPAGVFRVGSTFTPHLPDTKIDFLAPGMMGKRYLLSEQELSEFLSWDYSPLRIDGSLYWNNTLGQSKPQ